MTSLKGKTVPWVNVEKLKVSSRKSCLYRLINLKIPFRSFRRVKTSARVIAQSSRVIVHESLEQARCCQEPRQWPVCFWFVVRHFENRMAGDMAGERLTNTAHVQLFFAHCSLWESIYPVIRPLKFSNICRFLNNTVRYVQQIVFHVLDHASSRPSG